MSWLLSTNKLEVETNHVLPKMFPGPDKTGIPTNCICSLNCRGKKTIVQREYCTHGIKMPARGRKTKRDLQMTTFTCRKRRGFKLPKAGKLF